MKIVIVGAGIAGLSSYLFLKKHLLTGNTDENVTIVIYEAYDVHKFTANTEPLSQAADDEPVFTPAAIGNALGFSRNGLAALRRLDGSGNILRQLKRKGNPMSRWRLSNARGWTLGVLTTDTRPESGTANQGQHDDVDDLLMIARQDLWMVVRDEAIKAGATIVTQKVKDISIGDDTRKSIIEFDDGSSDEADLIIGADGLRSSLRRAMFEAPKSQPSESQTATGILSWITSWFIQQRPPVVDYVTPSYEYDTLSTIIACAFCGTNLYRGLGSLGGFIPTKELQHDQTFDPKALNLVFGRNGFVGYGCTSSAPSDTRSDDSQATESDGPGPVSMWWSSFSSPVPYPYRRQQQSVTTFDSTTALADLCARHRDWNNPTVQTLLKYISANGITATNFYPTWTTPELPHWQMNGRAVLIGDAAHAIPPSSGQGASQALEDAEALALLLSHYLHHKNDGKPLAKALLKFERLRIPHLHRIRARALRHGQMKADMGVAMEMLMYFFIWVGNLLPDKEMHEVVNYDLPGEVQRVLLAERD